MEMSGDAFLGAAEPDAAQPAVRRVEQVGGVALHGGRGQVGTADRAVVRGPHHAVDQVRSTWAVPST